MNALHLDDLRTPPNDREWVIVRTYDEAVGWLKKNGCPDHISFEHDLGRVIVNGKIITDDYEAKQYYSL